MSKFDPLSVSCPACPAQIGQWCDDGWPLAHPEFVQTVGFTHEQRTSYNLLADQPADGTPASDEQIRDAVLKSGRV
jgi:hypothetical protein